jgi:hypothetical protein
VLKPRRTVNWWSGRAKHRSGFDPESDEITYFASEAEADAAIPESAIDEARASFGAWADLGLEWDDVEEEFDRIRHGQPRASAKSE